MATAKKKSPTKRAAAAPKKVAARKKVAAKKSPAKKAAKGNFFKNALSEARDQMDMFVGSTKLKAKGMTAKARAIEKKAAKQGRVLKKKLESGAKKAFAKAPAKAKVAAKKKVTPRKKKAAATKPKSRAKK